MRASGARLASLLTSTIHSPVEAAIARATAGAKPVFSDSSITVASGWRSRTSAAVTPSEAFRTTISSLATPARAASTWARHSSSSSRAWWSTTTMEAVTAPATIAARSRAARRGSRRRGRDGRGRRAARAEPGAAPLPVTQPTSGAAARSHASSSRACSSAGPYAARPRSRTASSACAAATWSPGGDGRAQAVALDALGQLVAARADDRQPGPDAVEQPRAEGEARLEVLAVRGDRAVGVEQPVGALLVGHPLVVERDHGAEQPQLLRQGARLRRRPLGLAARRAAHEHEPQSRASRRELRHRADRGGRVEPVPDAAVPEHELLVAAARADPAALRRLGRHAERDDVQHRAQRRVIVVALGREQALGEHRPEPQVALLLRRAHDVARVAQRGEDAVQRQRPGDAPHRARAARQRLQQLERLRVVEVGHEAGARAPDRGRDVRPRRLRDDHAGPRQLGTQGPRVGAVERDHGQLELRQRLVAARAGEHDVRVAGQRPPELIGADRRPGHAGGERLGGDQQHALSVHAALSPSMGAP